MKWTEEETATLQRMYGKVRISEICELLGKKSVCVRQRAARIGLKSNRSIANAHFTLNRSYFDVVNTANSYWAGFIAADGYVTKDRERMSISLATKDRCVLEQFKQDVEYTGSIYDYSKHRVYSRVELHSQEICRALEKNFGIDNNKTFTLEPPHLDDRFILSFIIGLIDGDGWIYIDHKRNSLKLGLVGTLPIISWAKSHCDLLLGKATTSIYKSGRMFRFEYSGQQAKDLRSLLLEVETPYKLPRKWYGA